MSASGSNPTWLSLLEEKKQNVNECFGQGYATTGAINTGRSFRSALESFYNRKGAEKVSRVCARILPSYTPIVELAKAASESAPDLQGLAPNHTLESLIWWISFALIERGYKAEKELDSLIILVAELNNKVPSFSSRLQFPHEKRVQKPLQEVYHLFIDAHIHIASYFGQKDSPKDVDPTRNKELGTYISDTATRLEEARGRHKIMVDQAKADEERERYSKEQPNLIAQRNSEVRVRFQSQRLLGHGSYGTVDEVREKSTGDAYARKHISLKDDNDKAPNLIENEVKNEVAIMQKLSHLHIARVLFYLKEEEAYSIFMLPVADYDLRRFLSNCTSENYPSRLTKNIFPWFGCLLDALAYAHKLRIRHQDIKPSNILIKNEQPYLCDFGLAKDFTELDTSKSRGDKVQGTPVYRAPEVAPKKERGRKADVFALGCVYSEMLTITQKISLEEYRDARQEAGSTAFRDCLPKVEIWLRRFEGQEGKPLIDTLVDQILSMIHANPEKRQSAEQAVKFLYSERALFCVE